MNKSLIFVMLVGSTLGMSDSQCSSDPSPAKPAQNAESFCQEANGKRETYFAIWKNQFLKRNAMAREYFDEHVSVTKYEMQCQWQDGIILRVEYDVTYDWAVVSYYDQVIVMLYDQGTAYRYLPIKRNHFFTEEEVAFLLDNNVYGKSITPVKSLTVLGFSNYETALAAFQEGIGGYTPINVKLSFYVPGKIPRMDGDPYLIGFAVVDEAKNDCRSGYLNLVTGQVVANPAACWVN